MNELLLNDIDCLANELQPELEAISQALFERPELGLSEHFACGLLVGFLQQQGFQVQTGLAGLDTSFRAEVTIGEGGPAIAFLAEYDALPEIGHACGHNLIAASAIGAAALLKRLLGRHGGCFTQQREGNAEKPNEGGRIIVLGTPAEETLGGKIPMLAGGAFQGIDATVMLHPESVNIARGKALALDHLRFRFLGKSAHAASLPGSGINALEAAILTFNQVQLLREQLPVNCLAHGIITQGGVAANIIPDLAIAEFMVRAPTRSELDPITERVRDCARAAASVVGCRLEIEEASLPCDEMAINEPLADCLVAAMQRVGLSVLLPEDPAPGSSDFGNVSQVVPAAYAFVASSPPGVELHSREFAQATVSLFGRQALATMVRVLAEVGARYLLQTELQTRVREHFLQFRNERP